jgi:hypothetical protein
MLRAMDLLIEYIQRIKQKTYYTGLIEKYRLYM